MFDQKRILAVIPARGGSKGVPRKNIRLAGGKPLIAWVIEAARNSRYIDKLVLSSDDAEIIGIAEKLGCDVPFVRPPELARDDSPTSDSIIHALNELPGYDYVMVLQPTSPLTSTEDIDESIATCIYSKNKALVSVAEPEKSPYWMFRMGQDKKLEPVFDQKYLKMRRQDLPPVYLPTGSIYMAETEWYLEHQSFYSDSTVGYIISAERILDIDTEKDFKLFELIRQEKSD